MSFMENDYAQAAIDRAIQSANSEDDLAYQYILLTNALYKAVEKKTNRNYGAPVCSAKWARERLGYKYEQLTNDWKLVMLTPKNKQLTK